MRVRILKTEERLGVIEGEIYSARRYRYDSDKYTLLAREDDGYDPECNQYKHQLAYWIDNQWMVLKDNMFIPE